MRKQPAGSCNNCDKVHYTTGQLIDEINSLFMAQQKLTHELQQKLRNGDKCRAIFATVVLNAVVKNLAITLEWLEDNANMDEMETGATILHHALEAIEINCKVTVEERESH